jgi:hypothetical protein
MLLATLDVLAPNAVYFQNPWYCLLVVPYCFYVLTFLHSESHSAEIVTSIHYMRELESVP